MSNVRYNGFLIDLLRVYRDKKQHEKLHLKQRNSTRFLLYQFKQRI